MVFLTFGTGMGAGLIFDGKLYTGSSDMAGEIGHVRMSDYGSIGYGNSKNVIYAAVMAKALGIPVLSMTGEKESRLSQIGDVTIRVPSIETYLVQEYHLPVYHYLCAQLEAAFFHRQSKTRTILILKKKVEFYENHLFERNLELKRALYDQSDTYPYRNLRCCRPVHGTA